MANPHVEHAKKYARDVVAGKIPVCKWVRLACEKFINDLALSKDKKYKYEFSTEAAERACRFIELLPHTKGKWALKKELIVLQPWQCFGLCNIFGWLRRSDGKRRYRRVYWKIPRKNGKSIIAAGIGLYMYAADGEFGAEVYSGATTKDQAMEVFRPAKQMLERSPELIEAIGAESWAMTLLTPSDGSRFAPIIGKPGDGSSPSCAIIDEYHEHENSDQMDTLETGTGAREQPLILVITTAGYNITGPCYQLEQDAKNVLEGVFDDEQLFPLIYGTDEEDDPFDPATLHKANPNIGVSVDEEFLLNQQKQAFQDAGKQVRFKTKHLNVWCNAKTAWLNINDWMMCADRTLRKEQFKGCLNWKAVDLASRSDVCADVDIFRKDVDGLPHYYLFGRYRLPEKAIETNPKNAQLYRRWVIEGFLDEHQGAEIDFDVVRDEILSDVNKYSPEEVLFDPHRASLLMQQMTKENMENVVEFRQTVLTMSTPMKEFESAVKGGRIHHDGNPVLTWMVSNVVAKIDAKDNIYPRKEKPENKIDGVVAAIMALARASVGDVQTKSFWETEQ